MPAVSLALAIALAAQSPAFQAPPNLTTPVVDPCPPDDEHGPLVGVGIGKTVEPKLSTRFAPRMTAEASRANVDALVWVTTVVDVDGKPCDLQIARSSHPGLGLEEASLDAVRKARFWPAKRDGVPLRATFTIAMHFGVVRTDPRTGARRDAVWTTVPAIDPLLKDVRPRTGQSPPP